MATQVEKLKTDGTGGAAHHSRCWRFLGAHRGASPSAGASFLHEVRVEMRQVTWPTRHEVFVTTFVVIVAVAFFGVFFFGVDSSVSWLVAARDQTFSRH